MRRPRRHPSAPRACSPSRRLQPTPRPPRRHRPSPPPRPPAAAATGPTSQLGTLVSQHEQLVSTYQQDLEREYDFFVAAAQSTAIQQEVIQAATQTQQPDAANAITYDINLAYTQLAQEAAIRQAEARAA